MSNACSMFLPHLAPSQAHIEHTDKPVATTSDERPLLDSSPHCDWSDEQEHGSSSKSCPESLSVADQYPVQSPGICSTSTSLPEREDEKNLESSAWTWTDYLEVAGRVLGPPIAAGALMAWLSKKARR